MTDLVLVGGYPFQMICQVPPFSYLELPCVVEIDNEKVASGQLENIFEKSIDGVFVFIGYTPNTEFLQGKVKLNKWGEIITSEDLQVHHPGVYAAGDCINKKIRQVTTAVSDGTIAALNAAEYIHNKKNELVVV